MTEFAKRVIDSIDATCAGTDHTGEEIVVYVPTPHGYTPTTGEIELDDIRLDVIKDKKARNPNGDVIFEVDNQNVDLWRVSGKIKKQVI